MSVTPVLTRKITQAMRRNVIGLTLYSAADVPFTVRHDGVPYTMPPDGPSRERFPDREGVCRVGLVADKGEHAIYDGTLTVYDRYGVSKKAAIAFRKAQRSNRGRREPTPPEANILLAGAEAIAGHIERKLGKSGVTLLYGTPEEIEGLKRQAREKYLKFKVAQVDRVLKHYRDRTSAFHADPRNRGAYAPAMDEHELEAQEWLDAYRLGLKNVARLVCSLNCGFQAMDEAVIARHMRAAHPMAADAQMSEDLPPAALPAEPPAPEKKTAKVKPAAAEPAA